MHKKKEIYVLLKGRIGNQLFMYAFAKQLWNEYKGQAKIVIDDSEVLKANWENSLVHYDLPDVEYIHENMFVNSPKYRWRRRLRTLFAYNWLKKDYPGKYAYEKKWAKLLNKCGIIYCENGYLPYRLNTKRDVFIEGYFQSEKYFLPSKQQILNEFSYKQFENIKNYPDIDKIKNRNTVCISVKVEHNVGDELFDICDMEYWKKAIKYICDNVENPLFFIGSDNVPYVLEHLIDTSKYDYVCQSREFPVHESLAVMGLCKHFIIGNTSFGWWAQYLSDYDKKIVVAPSRWMNLNMPVDIYLDDWHLIDV
ncbi:MAG: alpha-1,2-fucosyltransferase [Lachnospiraceae bacterium]|jgi:hypothetical protein|nr:alpha-1,2-fucosyltransferase [Lachnospiraceae bacterium]